MIATLLITLLAEGIVATGYALWRKRPVASVLWPSVLANLLTQSFLWIVLSIFFRHYLIALFLAEMLIWLMESILLAIVPTTQVRFPEALWLSFVMNLTSFAVGWGLPV